MTNALFTEEFGICLRLEASARQAEQLKNSLSPFLRGLSTA
jgi:hypothetical protein